jgi:hypothetical protein
MTIHVTPKKEKQSILLFFSPLSPEYKGAKGIRLMRVIPKEGTTYCADKNGNPIEQIAVHNSKLNRWEINLNKKVK